MTSVNENKVMLYAPISVDSNIEKAAAERAQFLAFPEEKQRDLQYIRAILVSAGTNKNGAHFLPSEMVKARTTISNKAIDLEHEEDKVIGHIYDCAYMYRSGEVFDPEKTMAEFQSSGKVFDDTDIAIAVAGIIHRLRFPDLAKEVADGNWKVSMECLFSDFDIMIGKQIISRQEANALGLKTEDLVGNFIKVVAGFKDCGKQYVARVLRNINFSGMGIVKNPANPDSIILETAAHRKLLESASQVIDLERLDNLRGHKVIINSAPVIQIHSTASQTTEYPKTFVELDPQTGGIQRVLTASKSDKEDATLRNSGPGLGSPGSVTSFIDSTCKSFKKRLTKFNALDQSEGVVIREHWCALFEEACPVIGASAKAPECLRNKYNRTVRDPADNTLTRTIREHLDSGPGNSLTFNPQTEILEESPKMTAATNDELSKLRSESASLLKELREFTASQKKTSK